MRAVLERHPTISIDTSIFIYEFDENPRYIHLTHAVFQGILSSSHRAITSTLMMTEILVKPYRDVGEDKATFLYQLLSEFPNLEWIAPDLPIANLAARYRSEYNLQAPDAILAATVVRGGATCLITNDSVFRRIPEFETVLLDELL